MKILLDAMYDGLKEYLTEEGWNVLTVRDIDAPNAKDAKVRSYAKENGYTIVTQDGRSADIAIRSGIPCIHVSLGDIAELVKTEIKKKYP